MNSKSVPHMDSLSMIGHQNSEGFQQLHSWTSAGDSVHLPEPPAASVSLDPLGLQAWFSMP